MMGGKREGSSGAGLPCEIGARTTGGNVIGRYGKRIRRHWERRHVAVQVRQERITQTASAYNSHRT